MSAFRRVTQAIKSKSKTPPPAEPRPDRAERPTVTPAEVKMPLRKLLMAKSLDEPEAKEARETLLKIASVCGFYLTASTLNRYLMMMPAVTEKGVENHKGRGYEFAGELYFLHLQKEIGSMEGRTRPLGPGVFKGYCDELFDSFLAGDNVRKGIDSSILIMEGLLAKAVTSIDHRNSFLELAEQAIKSAAELTLRKHEKDVAAARRAARLHKRGAAPEPEAKGRHAVIDKELVAYLTDLGMRFDYVQESFSNISSRPVSPGQSGTGFDLQLEYLSELQCVAEASGYLGFRALLKEKVGAFLQMAQQERASEFLVGAAHDYETQADREHQLFLIRVCTSRYQKARDLFMFTNMRQNAAQVESKIAEVRNAHDSLLRTIPQF